MKQTSAFQPALFVLLAALCCPTGLLHGEQENPDPSARDAEYRSLIVGTWEDDYQGRRTMTIREDGTGIMVVELSGMKAKLYASRLEFDMIWSIRDGRLKKETISGRPAVKVNLILKLMGNRVDEPILELTKNRLLLLDANGKTKYDWRKVIINPEVRIPRSERRAKAEARI
jgi:hypothetical protein